MAIQNPTLKNLRDLIEATVHADRCEDAERKASHDLDAARTRLAALSHHSGPGGGPSLGVGRNVPELYVQIDGDHWKVVWTGLGEGGQRVTVEPFNIERGADE